MTDTEWELNHYLLREYMNGGVCQVCDLLDSICGQGYYNFWPLFCKDFPRLQEFCLFQVVLSPQTLILSYCEPWFLHFTMHQNHLHSSPGGTRICIFNKYLGGRWLMGHILRNATFMSSVCIYFIIWNSNLIHGS